MNKAQQTQMEGQSEDNAHFAIRFKATLKFII